MGPVSLDIDLDLLADIVDESLPWLEAWTLILALSVGFTVLAIARELHRQHQNPVARMLRRRRL